MSDKSSTNLIAGGLLRPMAANFNLRSSIKEYMRSDGSWIDFTIGFRTENSSVERAVRFRGGKAKVLASIPIDADATMIFSRDETLIGRTELEQVPNPKEHNRRAPPPHRDINCA